MTTQIQEQNKLIQIVSESGLEKTKAQTLLDNFTNYFELAADWEQKTKNLIVTDVSQIAEMKMAREGRLFLKQKRVDVEKTRKQLKDSSLREGQTIDAIAKILTNLIEPLENDLEQKEKFKEIQEAKTRAELRAFRLLQLEPYKEFAISDSLDMGSISEEQFNNWLNGARLLFEANQMEIKEAERLRLQKEKAEQEERKRIQLENVRLRKEAEAKQKELEKQKKLADEKLKAEQLANQKALDLEKAKNDAIQKEQREKLRIAKELQDKLESELKAKKDQEEAAKKEAKLKAAKELQEKELQRKKAEAAPDKERLLMFSRQILGIDAPALKTKDAVLILENALKLLAKVSDYINQNVERL